MVHELFLVEQNFDLAGFPERYREAILSFLNPFDENYNKRTDASVIFIAFDFAVFAAMNDVAPDDAEAVFSNHLRGALGDLHARLDTALAKHLVKQHSVDVFFLPLPSVDALRTMFQNRIGWTS